MQNEAAAGYTRFTCGRRLSQRGAVLVSIAPSWCERRAYAPLEAAPPLTCALGTGRALRAVSMARDGLLPGAFREPVRVLQRIYTARGRELLAFSPACKPRSPAFSSSR